MDYHQTNRKTDTGETLKPWPVLVDHYTFLMALRHVIEARGGMASVAQKAGVSRETLYRTLSAKGNPTLKTLRNVVNATGFPFSALVSA
ncbi:hypothetical protein ABM016_14700 [Morganella morganii]|uniref:helix-turn-helix domain-containing transcriptional regulator n=1 Tax=Morganella morganii TaxID=582 RepID=UPI003EBE98CA